MSRCAAMKSRRPTLPGLLILCALVAGCRGGDAQDGSVPSLVSTMTDLVSPPPPPAPPLAPEVAAGRKTSAMAECMNRFGENVRRVRDAYLEKAVRERGPRRPTDIVPSVFDRITSDIGAVPHCREVIERAVAMPPALSELDAGARRWITALETARATSQEAKIYYERQLYEDDRNARMLPLHTALVTAFDEFLAADAALDAIITRIEGRALETRLRELERTPGQRGRYYVERSRGCAMRVVQLVTRLELRAMGRRQRFVAADPAGLTQTVEGCQRHIDEMVAARETATVDANGAFRRDAQTFVAAAMILARAVRDDTVQPTEADARTRMNHVVEAYNVLVDDYNRL